ncbi:MAG: biotin/lipoyl-binding protein [Armatimonadetes bacterium]|nr:biotin/lipoyl-binding protein [Armatimonadota bacterium]
MRTVDGAKDRITTLANLIDEFNLAEATWEDEELSISLIKSPRTKQFVAAPSMAAPAESGHAEAEIDEAPAVDVAPVAPAGTPLTSPMNGIFYATPNPNAKAFAEEGSTVTAGQVVGLIEAMKVFNEIHAPVSGRVLKVVAENGQVVAPGDVLLYIG